MVGARVVISKVEEDGITGGGVGTSQFVVQTVGVSGGTIIIGIIYHQWDLELSCNGWGAGDLPIVIKVKPGRQAIKYPAGNIGGIRRSQGISK